MKCGGATLPDQSQGTPSPVLSARRDSKHPPNLVGPLFWCWESLEVYGATAFKPGLPFLCD